MRIITAIALTMVLGSGAAFADSDHLLPESGAYLDQGADDIVLATEYDRVVVTVMKRAFTDDVKLRAIYGGSTVVFDRAVGLRGGPSGYAIFSIMPVVHLFAYAERAQARIAPGHEHDTNPWLDGAPEHYGEVGTEDVEYSIDAQLAHDIETVWDRMLRATRYESLREANTPGRNPNAHWDPKTKLWYETVPVDTGFPIHVSNRSMAGTIVGDGGPKTKALADIAETMEMVCQSQEPESKLRAQVTALLAKLTAEEDK